MNGQNSVDTIKTWAVDENGQVLMQNHLPVHEQRRFDPRIEELLKYDLWTQADALTLIVTGCSDAEAHTVFISVALNPLQLKEWTEAAVEAMMRAKRIAQSSIDAGKLKDPDTPESWIAWARSKGYKTNHLQPQNGEKPNKKEAVKPYPQKLENNAESPAEVFGNNTQTKPKPSLEGLSNEQWVPIKYFAAHMGLSTATIYRRVKSDPTCPQSNKDKRWQVGAIKAYAEKQR